MSSKVVIAALMIVTAGCGREVPLGGVPGLVWWTGVESGDLGSWTEDGGGGRFIQRAGTLEVVTARARRGQYALEAAIVPADGQLTQAVVYRQGPALAEGYYSAWFYLPEAYATDYLALLKIAGRTRPEDPASFVDGWDLVARARPAGGFALLLFRHDRRELVDPGVEVPVARWFHLEVLVKAASDATGRLTVWRDGLQTVDLPGTPTLPSPFVWFGVGAIGSTSATGRQVVYIDDAAIARARVGTPP